MKAPETPNLHQRIRAVMQEVEYLNKDKQVGEGNYSYKAVSEESVTANVRKQLIKHGLVLFPISQTHRHEELPRLDRYGKESVLSLTTVDVTYKLVNVDNPAEFELIASSGTGVDPQDKGVGKAMTYAFKYALLRTFAIPTGNDPDMVHNDVLEAQAPARAMPSLQEAVLKETVLNVQQVVNALAQARSIIELKEIWESCSQPVQNAIKAEFTTARARIEATVAAAAGTPVA
jgi:hypothetical protein